jgi:hypothetical protein
MTTTKDLLKTKKNTLLTELESIKNLLDAQETDNIPLLQDTIIPKGPEAEAQPLSAVTDGVLPGQRSLFNEAKAKFAPESGPAEPSKNQVLNDVPVTFETNSNNISTNNTSTAKTANTSSLSNNPFLPAHVRLRLQRDANNQQQHNSDDDKKSIAIVDASYTQRLVDQLVAHHLPKIEQELRRKLVQVVHSHNDIIKK